MGEMTKMVRIKEVNLFEDKKLLITLNIASLLLMVLFIFIFYALGLALAPNLEDAWSFMNITSNYFLRIFYYFLVFIVIITVHELIHGFFFKLFTPNGKVRFGFKAGMAYTTSPGNFYSKGQMFVIAISPFMIITTILIIILYLLNVSVLLFAIFAALHAAGCSGDFYYVYLVMTSPKGTQFEDTEVGISLYVSEESEEKKHVIR